VALLKDMMQNSPSSIIATYDLTKCFGHHLAVDHVNLNIHKGEIFGLIGPNGSGKSTLIKMLTTLLPISEGHAVIAGYNVKAEPNKVREHIGYVPQLLSSDGSLTGRENLRLSARLYLISAAEQNMRIDQALDMMGLTDHADELVQHYSGGMIRRLELGQGMIHRPDVIFMDEPSVGLDPIARHAVWDYIKRLRDEMNSTILITTHFMDEAETLCDRIGILNKGSLESIGTPQELKQQLGKNATMDDVFIHINNAEASQPADYSDISRERRHFNAHS